jgi:hypothetical protein
VTASTETYDPVVEAERATTMHARRILIVADRTAATPWLLNEVRARARAQPCEVALLIPENSMRKQADCTFEVALPPLERAVGGPVTALAGAKDVIKAVGTVLRNRRFDEIIVSTLPSRSLGWLRRNVPRRIERLGGPVTVVTAAEPDRDPWREFTTTARVRAGEATDRYC